jgi:hypothetical protein
MRRACGDLGYSRTSPPALGLRHDLDPAVSPDRDLTPRKGVPSPPASALGRKKRGEAGLQALEPDRGRIPLLERSGEHAQSDLIGFDGQARRSELDAAGIGAG